jgi:hypothetical protein
MDNRYFYSASARGFYVSTIHRSMPADVVEISEDEWKALIIAQSRGMTIATDQNGRPIAAQPEVQ